MTKGIRFRKEALKHLHSPDQLDQLIEVVNPYSWLIAGTLYVLLIMLIIWSIFGSIETRVDGQGILLEGGGDIYNAVAPDGPSHIRMIKVKPGDKVEKGQILATLDRPDLADQIQVTGAYLKDLKTKQAKLLKTSEEEIKSRQKDLEDQRKALQRIIVAATHKFNSLEELLKIKQESFKKGIETRQNVVATLEEYYNVKSELEGYDDKLVELKISESNLIDQWRERRRELELKITDETVKFNDLKNKMTLSSNIVSPVKGTVTGIRANVGSIVKVGDAIISIASKGNELDALVYLSPKKGKQVKARMKALVVPTNIEKAEYGSILGEVIDVSEFPSTAQAMNAVLQNEELVKQFSRDEVPIAIRIHLYHDPNTPSGLQWTSSQGPQAAITPGTIVHAFITVRTQAPITLVIPRLKKWGGIE